MPLPPLNTPMGLYHAPFPRYKHFFSVRDSCDLETSFNVDKVVEITSHVN